MRNHSISLLLYSISEDRSLLSGCRHMMNVIQDFGGG